MKIIEDVSDIQAKASQDKYLSIGISASMPKPYIKPRTQAAVLNSIFLSHAPEGCFLRICDSGSSLMGAKIAKREKPTNTFVDKFTHVAFG